MIASLRPVLITGAWPDTLSEFLRATRQELLVASPWITEGVARFIAGELALFGPITVQILSRMDEADFLNGSSHIVSFRKDTYPGYHRVIFRALPMLHGKLLIADRQSVILGSANLTDGGLYRNHELSLRVDSREVGHACAQEFFRLWSIASEVPADYLDTLERALEDALPASGEEDAARRPVPKSRKLGSTKGRPVFRYVSPTGATSARRLISTALLVSPPHPTAHEERDAARIWLERNLKFLPAEERRGSSVVERLERLMYHPDTGIRAMAIDRAGRSGNRSYLPRLQAIATNASEPHEVRGAAAFGLTLLGSPESFSTLSELLTDGGDTARWARRGCFLLITDVDADSASWLLRALAVDNPSGVMALARACNVSRGSISERLTKALIVEQFAMGFWTEEDLERLVSVMALTASAIQVVSRKLNVLAIAKYAADALGVAPGDLRHGPLSPSFLSRAAASGLTDPGLTHLIGDAWARLYSAPASAKAVLAAHGNARKVVQLVDEAQSS